MQNPPLDLHYSIIGIENRFVVFLQVAIFTQVLLYKKIVTTLGTLSFLFWTYGNSVLQSKKFMYPRPASEPSSPTASRSTTPGPSDSEEGGPVKFDPDDDDDEDDDDEFFNAPDPGN